MYPNNLPAFGNGDFFFAPILWTVESEHFEPLKFILDSSAGALYPLFNTESFKQFFVHVRNWNTCNSMDTHIFIHLHYDRLTIINYIITI